MSELELELEDEELDDEATTADEVLARLLDLNPDLELKGAVIEEVVDRDDQDKKLELGEDEENRITKEIDELVKKSISDDRDKRADWIRADKAYKAKMKKRNFPWVGASSTPVGYVKVKTRTIAREVEGAISQYGVPWPLEPEEESDIKRTELTEAFINSDAKKNMNIEEQVYLVAMDATRYGTGLMKVTMVNETEQVTEVQVYDGKNPDHQRMFMEHFPRAKTEQPLLYVRLIEMQETLTLDVSYEKEIRRGPRAERVARPKVFTPAGYTNENRLPWFFEEMEMSWSDLVAAKENKGFSEKNLEKLKYQYSNEKDPYEYTRKQYKVLEGMYKYPLRGGVHEKCLFTVMPDDNIFLRGIQYPFKHGKSYLVWHRLVPQGDDIDGESLALDAEPTQEMLFKIFNNTIDSDMFNLPTFKVKKSQTTNLAIQRWFPGKKFEVENMTDIEQMRSGSSSSNASNLMGIAQRFGDDLLSVNEGYSGRESMRDPDAPAKKTQMLLQMASRGIGSYLKKFLVGFNEVGIQVAELWNQYGTAGARVRLINDMGLPEMVPAPDDLRIRLDMSAHAGDGAFSRDAKREGLLGLMERMQKDPMMMDMVKQYPEGWRRLWVRLVEIWDPSLSKLAHQIVPTQEMIEKNQIEMVLKAMKVKEMQDNAKLAQTQGGGAGAMPMAQPGTPVSPEAQPVPGPGGMMQ